MQDNLLLFYISPLFLSALFGLFLTLFVYRNRRSPGAFALIALLLSGILWSVAYAMEIASINIGEKIIWAKIQYFGICGIPVAWFLFSMRYLGSPATLHRMRKFSPVLYIVPAITVVLVWTNEFHRLVWREVQILSVGTLHVLDFDHGTWFWIFWGFSYLLLISGSVWLISRLLGSHRLLRWQIGLALAGAIIPWIGNLLYVLHLCPGGVIDCTPFGFVLAGMLFSLSLFRFHLAKVIPIAHQVVFDEMSDGILVLDLQNQLIDMNRIAKKDILSHRTQAITTPISKALPQLYQLVENRPVDEEVKSEFTIGNNRDLRFYELHILPITDTHSKQIGRLAVFHDITVRKQAEARLKTAYEELEDRILERTEDLREANLKLAEELKQRRLAEGRFEDIVNSSPDAILLVESQGQIVLTNDQAAHLFGYPNGELKDKHFLELIPTRFKYEYKQLFLEFLSGSEQEKFISQYEVVGMCSDGSEFPIELGLSRLKASSGVLVAFVARDIRKRKQAEQEQAALLEEIQQSQKQLRALTTRLEESQELERRQIAVELHDRVGQSLTALNLNLMSIRNKLPVELEASIRNKLEDSLGLVEETTRNVRNVMAGLNPPMLEEFGLMPALSWYSSKFSDRTGIAVEVQENQHSLRMPQRVENALFRIVQETLHNAAKHSQATKIVISTSLTREMVSLSIFDNGIGFDLKAGSSSDDQVHLGLITMRERALSIGGQLIVRSSVGNGTEVMVTIRRMPDDCSDYYR